LNWLRGKGTLCHPVSASEYAAQLTGFYPTREVNNAKLYVVGMSALFTAYPADLVKRVCDPVRGLPGRLKWLPTIADAKEALDAEVSRRMRIEANAKWVTIEADRLAEEARTEEEWNKKYGGLTEEQRKAKVDALLRVRNLG